MSLDSHANRIRGDDIIKGSTRGGRAPSKGLMNRALSEFESPRRQNKAPPCRSLSCRRAGIGSRLTFQSRLERERERRAQESRWSIAIGRRGAVVSPARWRCRQFFYYESGHERRRARTHTWRSCSKESSFTSDFTDRDSRWLSVVSRTVLCRSILCIYQTLSRATESIIRYWKWSKW